MALMDEEPVKRPDGLGTKPLDDLSIDELEEYVAALAAEIERAKAMIERKNAHKASVSGLFKS